MGSRKRSVSSNDADMLALHKEWDEASCPICMDHPHNAVLLLCSSHDKGCRSFVCDTSYRHSNCLDRFKKLKDENNEGHNVVQEEHSLIDVGSGRGRADRAYARNLHTGLLHETETETETVGVRDPAALMENHGPENNNLESSNMSNLRCPICRGSIIGWKVVEEARRYINLKQRSCTRESCSFCGNYSELRRHARRVHPSVRPADIDRTRQRAWRHLETQREYDDIVTAIRYAMPGAIVVGDYVIENPQDNNNNNNNNRVSGNNIRDRNGRSLNGYMLFHMIDSMDSATNELRGGGRRSGSISRHRRRSPGGFSRHRYVWGENILGVQDDDTEVEDDDLGLEALNDEGEGSLSNTRRRQRRRFTRSRPNYH